MRRCDYKDYGDDPVIDHTTEYIECPNVATVKHNGRWFCDAHYDELMDTTIDDVEGDMDDFGYTSEDYGSDYVDEPEFEEDE